jgi:SWI/SNF-related matrix-associated actin-dependent regulator of chromatin subfamily A member 5
MVSSQVSEDEEFNTHKRQSKSAALKTHKVNNVLPKAADAKKRYAFLLGQTDIFAHFINVAKMKAGDKSVYKDFETGPKTSKRVRKTEKEEDEEMLVEDEKSEDDVFSFSESPDCTYITSVSNLRIWLADNNTITVIT